MTAIRSGGIIAAGEGARLKSLGVPKPLVPIAGVPLVAHVLSNFEAAGIVEAAIIFNGDEQDCAAFVRERFARLVPTVLVKSTRSSLESFREILAAAPPGRLLVSTVDAYCPREDFLRFVRAAERADDGEVVLAVTPFVDDEKPLWVRTASDGVIAALGGDGGDSVTAGIYLIPERVRRMDLSSAEGRLRDFLISLRASGEPMRAVSLPKVVDVDRAADVRSAEGLAREGLGVTR